ncbi:DUF2256 domain-containing protein [Flavitalea antarctica]
MKTILKENRPQKICETCGRAFSWRKKWKATWNEVKYCSDGCRKHTSTDTDKTSTNIIKNYGN